MVLTDQLQFGKTVPPSAVALGFFDGVHLGHRAVISEAVGRKKDGLRACVFTFTMKDARAASKGGASMIMSAEQKAGWMNRLGVDYLLMPDFASFQDLSPEAFVSDILMECLEAKVVVCGPNFHFGKGAAADVKELQRLCAKNGIQAVIVPPVLYKGEVISSTRIRKALLAGDVQSAAEMLGSPFSICRKVVHGRQLGRTLGSPTINQAFEAGQIIPRYGVYASIVEVDGQWYPGVTNVGIKPTVGGKVPLAETYIIGFAGDLYGKTIEVAFLAFERPEEKFPSVEILLEHIQRDAERAKQISGEYLKKSALQRAPSVL